MLVINPFVDSIRSQYEKNRSKLWKSPEVLPQFKSLSTIKAVQSIAGNGQSTGYKDWFESLESMKAEMDATDYDIAIIGCDAYGMHLATHAKRSGKIGIHNGSMTQFFLACMVGYGLSISLN